VSRPQSDDYQARSAYPDIMRRPWIAALTPALDWARPRVIEAGRSVRGGMIQMLTTPDPAPVWRGKWRRRFSYAAVGTATTVLGLSALTGFYGGLGLVVNLGAVLIVAAVGLLIRYPLLRWRLAWLALVLSVAFPGP